MSDEPPAARLFLITPPLTDARRFAPVLEAAVASADVACVLIRTRVADDGSAKAIIRALAPLVQAHDAAVLVEDDARLAARADADGVHMSRDGAAFAEALAALQPRRIVGCADLGSRDAAMRAAEAGADYVMFGAPESPDPTGTHERVAWWAGIFNVPCVGSAAHPDEAEALARAGAEFVALCDGLWDEPEHVAATLRRIAPLLHRQEPVS